jgi:hypothetical protein
MIKVTTVNFPSEEVAEVKQYTKKELCILYKICKNTLSAWIKRSLGKFESTGYNKYQKILTKAQVKLIFELWGEP